MTATVSSHLLEQLTALDAILWRSSEDPKKQWSLFAAVQEAKKSDTAQVTVETVITDSLTPNLDDLIPRDLLYGSRNLGDATLSLVHDESGPFVLGLFPTGHSGVFHLAGSVATTDRRWKRVERWVGKSFPSFIPCFLNHDDFSSIGTELASLGHVAVSRISARRLSDQSSVTRGWKEGGSVPRPTPAQAIAEADQDGASVRSLTLRVEIGMHLHLRRVAGATYYSGQFDKFQQIVLGGLARFAEKRRILLSDRERKIDAPPPRPISIRLSAPILVDSIATGNVLRVLEEQSKTAVAVLHRNPYLHVVVTDYLDGSNFDVFVTRPDEISVYPGFRSSLGAYSRLTQQLGDRFAAQEITEAPPPSPISFHQLDTDG